MTRRCQKPESHHKGVGQSPQGPELQHQGAREFFTRDWDLQQQMPSLRRQEWGHRDQRLRWYHHELQLHDGAESHVLRLVKWTNHIRRRQVSASIRPSKWSPEMLLLF